LDFHNYILCSGGSPGTVVGSQFKRKNTKKIITNLQVGITRHETDNDGGMRERITPGVDINSAAKCDFNETEGSYMDQSV